MSLTTYPSALPTADELKELDLEMSGMFQNTEAATESTEEISVRQEDAFESAKNSIDFLAALAMPDIYKYPFPPIYADGIWPLACHFAQMERDFTQLALGLPRGFAKTLVIKLLIVHMILFTKKRFILVISENEEKAISIISDVMDMLSEDNIKAVFGDWSIGKEVDNAKKKKFFFRGRAILLKPMGAKGSVRGITEKNLRPDVMIFDDIQDRDESESEVLSKQLERWLYGTAMKAKSPEGCLFLFVANMYPTRGSLLRKIKQNPNWIKYIVGGILADGTSLWEELQPIAQLMKEFMNDLISGQPEVFYAEVLNDETASVNSHIDLSMVPPYPYTDYELPVGSFVVIDPATDRANADSVTLGGFNIYDRIPVLCELEDGSFSPGKTVKLAIEMALKMQCSLIVVEANAYQHSLKYWIDYFMMKYNIQGITVMPIFSGSHAKSTRILTMFKALVAGEIMVHPDHKAKVFTQVSEYNPLKRDNIDGILDILTYAPRVLTEFPQHLALLNMTQDAKDDGGAASDADVSPF